MLPAPAHHVVIRVDYGGEVATYSARVSAYLKRKVTVRIEGECASACTMVTALRADRICVGRDAKLELHQAYLFNPFDPLDTTMRNEAGTAELMRHYPRRLRNWIAGKGGLTSELIILKGDELARVMPACRR